LIGSLLLIRPGVTLGDPKNGVPLISLGKDIRHLFDTLFDTMTIGFCDEK